jgi:CBS domain-containing protein
VESSHSSSESVITGTVVSFLKNVPPFQFLSVPELACLSRHMTLEFFPKDTVILSAGHPASESLCIVHKGGVKLALRSQVGKQLVLDMRSEGEIFGLLSVMSKDLARLDVTAIEDTLCYRVPAEQVQRLISSNAEVSSYLLRISVTRYMDRSLQELRTQTGLMGDTERLLYSLSASDVPGSPPLLCKQDTTIREAAQMLHVRLSTLSRQLHGEQPALASAARRVDKLFSRMDHAS